ncbi:MAG: hypothetical protein HQ559_05675 [Lentisphaerae bacterium]|nr:hypothetical protein [Lentisphaerota bacterium]
MQSNPLIERFRFSLMRPRQFWVYLGIYITVAVLILLINISFELNKSFFGFNHLCFSLFVQFSTLQIIILWVWASVNAGSAIRDEIRDKSYDFFKLLPMPAWKKAVGIMVGKNLVAHLLGTVTFLLLVGAGLLADVSIGSLSELVLLLVTVSIFLNLVALVASTQQQQKKTNRNMNALWLVILVFFLLGPIIGLFGELFDDGSVAQFTIPFFCWHPRGLLLISALAVYSSVWLFKGVCRRFRAEREPLFTRAGAILFMLGFLLVAFGLYSPHLEGEDGMRVAVSFWAVAVVVSWLVALATAHRFDSYVEKAYSNSSAWSFMLKQSNLAAALPLGTMWLAAAIVAAISADIAVADALLWLLPIVAFYAFYVLLTELFVVYSPVVRNVHVLLAFVGLLLAVLPLILGGLFQNPLYLGSPFGYFGYLIAEQGKDMEALHAVWIVYLLLSALATRLVVSRYREVLRLSQQG